MTKRKLFLATLTDLEDALQRMAALCRDVGEDDVALAASDAADHLLVLAGIIMASGSTVPVPDHATC